MKIAKPRFSPTEHVLTLAALGACWFMFYKYTYTDNKKKLQAASAALAQDRKALDELNSMRAKLGLDEILAKRKGSQTAAAAKTKAAGLPNYNFTDFLRDLSSQERNLRVNEIKSVKQQVVGIYLKTYYAMEVETSFLDLGQFIERLEKSNHIVEISNVTVRRIDKDLRRCTATIELAGFVTRSDGT